MFFWNTVYFSVRKREQNTLQLQHSSLIKTLAEKVKQFKELVVTIFALNHAVVFTTLQHAPLRASNRYVSDKCL